MMAVIQAAVGIRVEEVGLLVPQADLPRLELMQT
jgi:hypothetical protein